MAGLINAHEKLGFFEAKLAWCHCINVKRSSKSFIQIKKQISTLTVHITKHTQLIDNILYDNEMSLLIKECVAAKNKTQEQYEAYTERDYRPTNAKMDEKAVINNTKESIPEDVLMALSWGHKFLFPNLLTIDSISRYFAQIEHTLDNTLDTNIKDQVCVRIGQQFKDFDFQIHTTHIQWLSFIKYRVENFLKRNPHIKPIPSDKGKIIVIMYIDEYKEKLSAHLANTAHYTTSSINPLPRLIDKEMKLHKQIMQNTHFKDIIKSIAFNNLQLARFYGLIKTHKDFKIRPITACPRNVVGYSTNQILFHILSIVFPPNGNHLKNAYELKKQIYKTHISSTQVLVSFDAISMFTSIPTALVIKIIMSKATTFQEEFGINEKFLRELLMFSLNECNYFVAMDQIYKQKNGLPMGSSISTICCRLIMDHIMNETFSKTGKPIFYKIYVDDTIFIMEKKQISNFLNTLNSVCPQIQFTYEIEHNNMINFLNLTLIRTEHSRIITKYYRKDYASDRILNYYSAHKFSVIENTAIHMIKEYLALSDEDFFQENKEIIRQILVNNSFPEIKIIGLMTKYFTIMKPIYIDTIKEPTIYITYPHINVHYKEIKRLVKDNIGKFYTLSDSLANARNNCIRNIKQPIDEMSKTNIILKFTCQCKNKILIRHVSPNKTVADIVKKIKTNIDKCNKYAHAFNKYRIIKGLANPAQTKHLHNYIQWKYRHKVLDLNPDYPNMHLRRLLK